MLARSDRSSASAELERLGVFLTGNSAPEHAGILFQDAEGFRLSLEYSGGGRPQVELISDSRPIHWAPVSLSESDLDFLAIYAQALCEIDNLLYSPDFEGCLFRVAPGSKNQQLKLIGGTHVGAGLTCSTFVLLFFQENGFQLLDASTWIIRNDDRIFQERVIDYCRGRALINEAEYNSLKKRAPFIRFRPAETVGSAVQKKYKRPISLIEATELTDQIVAAWNI